jgi:hypothetical protein
MTTAATWTTAVAHANDADFRTWGKEISDKLHTMTGLTKVAETGTVNWTTVTRPSANTEGGFEVYYLNDSLHGTAPIYIRVSYGTASSAAYPGVSITVGTSTNGSGVLGGTALTTIKRWNKTGAATAGNHASYLCVKEGYFGLAWKVSAACTGVVVVCRSCDADGTPNVKAAVLVNSGTSNSCITQCLRFESAAAVYAADTGGNISVIVQYPTSSAVGANYQVYMCWMAVPDVRPIFGLCAVLVADYPVTSSISVALVGASARTYVSVGGALCSPISGANGGFAILYE